MSNRLIGREISMSRVAGFCASARGLSVSLLDVPPHGEASGARYRSACCDRGAEVVLDGFIELCDLGFVEDRVDRRDRKTLLEVSYLLTVP